MIMSGADAAAVGDYIENREKHSSNNPFERVSKVGETQSAEKTEEKAEEKTEEKSEEKPENN